MKFIRKHLYYSDGTLGTYFNREERQAALMFAKYNNLWYSIITIQYAYAANTVINDRHYYYGILST